MLYDLSYELLKMYDMFQVFREELGEDGSARYETTQLPPTPTKKGGVKMAALGCRVRFLQIIL